MAKKTAGVYQDKKSKSFYYIIDLNKGIDGERKQKKKGGFKTEAEAILARSEDFVAIKRGTYAEPSKILYKEFLKDWLASKRHNLNSQTFIGYEAYIRIHISPQLGHIPLSKVNANTIQNFITILSDKGLASATVKRIYNVVHSTLKAATRLRLVPENPCNLIVDKPKVQRKEIHVWNETEIQLFLTSARQSSRYYMAFRLALATGMRQGEILGLRWIDADLEKGILHVRQTISHDGKEIQAGAKTKSSLRSIAIDIDTIRELKKHKAMQNAEKLALEHYQDNGLIICTSKGTIATPRSLMKAWTSLLNKVAVPKTTFHGLRHTHASALLKLDVHPKVVQERLGHSSITMTLDLYSHLMPNMQSDAANVLGKALFGT